ncbi:MAG TPA: GNAT family N-acetyltransferase [Ideonella sp.]|uniref:GNAT family N-acetyltransferase n=1 Tax=Ideonella sp. TaxID=1929293 RepID=UPI002B92BD5E|nr:GNAT family N-acetyltransferase [Ideonella sp.]HSI50578.1 GNAT family N-acetyltransferase [Ideonella sp.]
MPTPDIPRIEAVQADGFDAFCLYLADHLGDNGLHGHYFQPLPAAESRPPLATLQSFRQGATIALPAPGWRRTWVARNAGGDILGHIDLRAHAQPHASHRCLLGMGVHRDHRQRGLGARLLAHATQWAEATGTLHWVDLQVLSANRPAVQLYLRNGFQVTGEIPDMFLIDGRRFAFTSMTQRVAASQAKGAHFG